jgi:hypothetical protein
MRDPRDDARRLRDALRGGAPMEELSRTLHGSGTLWDDPTDDEGNGSLELDHGGFDDAAED